MSSHTSDQPPPAEKPGSSNLGHLIAAIVLIGLAITGLGLYDRLRERPVRITPPHEPSVALIAANVAQPSLPAANAGQSVVEPTHPAISVAAESPAPVTEVSSAAPLPSASVRASSPKRAAARSDTAYVVQVGVFNSPANAQALQNQLRHAGIAARLETRVQIGPFKDKHEADKAMARTKKLGINAILVKSR